MHKKFYTKKSEVEDRREEIEIDQLYEDVGNSPDSANDKAWEKGNMDYMYRGEMKSKRERERKRESTNRKKERERVQTERKREREYKQKEKVRVSK